MITLRLERNPPLLVSLVVGGLALALFGLIAFGVMRLTQVGPVRCYSVSQPFGPMDKLLLAGPNYDCIDDRCWAFTRLNQANALVCFFPRLLFNYAPVVTFD
jgi:hypothetical protein